jgi:hypothetical protein
MCIRTFRLAARVIGAAALVWAGTVQALAQAQTQAPHQHEQHQPAPAPDAHAEHLTPQDPAHAGHDMTSMAREGSGTGWLPDASPMYALHGSRGGWTLMAHENAFLQYVHESGDRGADQGGSINWFMGMAERPLGRGRLALRGMISLEPWTIPGCGYPDLLASGEQCGGEQLHDRQHPHDLLMELAARFDAPLAGGLRWQVYGGPAGEPALGPVAFPHRVSALPNPIAPIAHHWLDATHVSFGVVTGGVYGRRWKAESSLFNGREPDERRTDVDFGALDSVSGRVWFLPARYLALQISAGRLSDAEAGEAGAPRTSLTRVTASATVHAPAGEGRIWATTVAWGRNSEEAHASNAWLLETNLTLRDRDVWFGRFEQAAKSSHDLALDGDATFTVSKLQGGYTRYFPPRGGFVAGFGGALSAAVVPAALRPIYGRRFSPGVAVFLTARPARAN